MPGPHDAGETQPPLDLESGLPADLAAELGRSDASLAAELSGKLDLEAGLAFVTGSAKREAAEAGGTANSYATSAKREAAEHGDTGNSYATVAVAVDEGAFIRALYTEHAGAVLRYALHLTGGDRLKAEDLVQETLVRAWRHQDAMAGHPVRPWLFAVARNLALNAYRAGQSRPPEADPATPETMTADDGPDRMLNTWAAAEALASLRPEYRALIIEAYYRGSTVQETAAALDISVGAVKSRIYHALKALKAALQERGIDLTL